MADEFYNPKQLQEVLRIIAERTEAERAAENELLGLRISNAERLAKLQLEQINKIKSYQLQQEHLVNERLIKMGYDAAKVASAQQLRERLRALDEEEKKRLEKVKNSKGTQNSIRKEYEQKRAAERALHKDIEKEEKAWLKEKAKQEKKQSEDLYKQNQKHFDSLGNALFSKKRFEDAVKEMTEQFMEQGLTEPEAKQKATEKAQEDRKTMAKEAAYQALAGFAKQLEGTMNDVGLSKSAIDTRLQGSNNANIGGSYWELMNTNVTARVGMSPFVKQADVVNNLKTLVGRGIAFNVEQRAFLDTISDKIANTFDATDNALLKLVRIQQADTTAARLGMESALTSFLNNMYETTEYMTDAAASIRQSIYEASALMGAAEATAFEYQVQKWMGSLYSVGFSNTEGLAGALGKLASGDISGINEGGYGNLLIMAANRAGLSVADILAQGLDDSETNMLLKAMVEYLGDIYGETKNSKVVQQQFANVFGLTASDLKAAANLFGSTETIGKNNLQYGGMIDRLQRMAASMAMRTSVGEMSSNIFENLKFATAANMANNPLLYLTYSIAGMLDDTAGGIAIPSIMAMGSGFDLETTVADLMRVSSMGLGLLGGLGTMITGLFGGGTFNPLAAYGIGNTMKTLSRGNGTGINAITMNSAVSESGSYVGNSNASDIQGKTMQDAEESANEKVEATEDERGEVKLSTIDGHILDIYDILYSAFDGANSLKVSPAGASSWNDIMGGNNP